MEIKASEVKLKSDSKRNLSIKSSANSNSKFSDELSELQKINKNNTEKSESKNDVKKTETPKDDKTENDQKTSNNNDAEKACDELSQIMSEINQSEDKQSKNPKENKNNADITNIGVDVINKDFNIDNKDILPQMNPNMNFGAEGQPFSSFMQNNQNSDRLSSSSKELAEEAAVLSTMAENIALANSKINLLEPSDKTVLKDNQLKKIDTQTNIVSEIVVKYDNIVMNEADAQVFADLADGKEVNFNNFSAETVQKSLRVSKNLLDALAKSMENNKPLRIEFDNGISVIIKISRDGKLSADFLPSTLVAEAYLKENLPLLKQRLSEQNLDYDQLNQRERRDREREQNRKKGREDE